MMFWIFKISIFFARKKPILLIFVGDLVMETLLLKSKEWSGNCNFMFIHTDASQAIRYTEIKDVVTLNIGDKEPNNCGKREFEDGVKYVQQKKTIIFKEIKKLKPRKVVLISTLRYSSACGITAELYSLLNQKNYNSFVIGIKPLEFEGKKAMVNFQKALKQMEVGSLINVHFINPNIEQSNIAFEEFINEHIYLIVNNLLSENYEE